MIATRLISQLLCCSTKFHFLGNIEAQIRHKTFQSRQTITHVGSKRRQGEFLSNEPSRRKLESLVQHEDVVVQTQRQVSLLRERMFVPCHQVTQVAQEPKVPELCLRDLEFALGRDLQIHQPFQVKQLVRHVGVGQQEMVVGREELHSLVRQSFCRLANGVAHNSKNQSKPSSNPERLPVLHIRRELSQHEHFSATSNSWTLSTFNSCLQREFLPRSVLVFVENVPTERRVVGGIFCDFKFQKKDLVAMILRPRLRRSKRPRPCVSLQTSGHLQTSKKKAKRDRESRPEELSEETRRLLIFTTPAFFTQPSVRHWRARMHHRSFHLGLPVPSPELNNVIQEQLELLQALTEILQRLKRTPMAAEPQFLDQVLFYGAALGWEAGGCMLPYDDDLDVVLGPETHGDLVQFWSALPSVPEEELYGLYRSFCEHGWNDFRRCGPGILLARASFFQGPAWFKLLRESPTLPLNARDISGLDVFAHTHEQDKVLPVPTSKNTVQVRFCGCPVQMYKKSVARAALDKCYSHAWRRKLISPPPREACADAGCAMANKARRKTPPGER